MSNKNKTAAMLEWLKLHGVKTSGDLVFDGQGMVTFIDIGRTFEIRIRPLSTDHNLGEGYGEMVIIYF